MTEPAGSTIVLSRSKKLAFSAALALLALGATEIGWRIHAHRKYREKIEETRDGLFVDHELLGSVYKVGPHTIPIDGEEPVRFHINEHRLRGAEVLEPKPAGLIRILCLGGSTTFGTSCKSDGATYPARLEARLEADDPSGRYEVLNAGVPGYRTAESYHNLERLRPLEPDIVLVYHAINDICWGVVEPFYLDPESYRRPESRLERRRREAESFLLEALWHRMFQPRVKNPKGRQSLDERVVEGFADNLRRIAKLAAEIDAVPAFITFEARIEADLPEEVRREIEAEHAFELSHMTYDGMVAALARLNETIRAVASELGVHVIELEGRLPHDREYWPDFVHLTEEGTRLKADAIYEGLLPVIERLEAGRRSAER